MEKLYTHFTTPTSCGVALSLPKPMKEKEAKSFIREFCGVKRVTNKFEIW